MINNNPLKMSLIALFLFSTPVVMAAVSPEEAAHLKNDLTPFGAQKAGNSDGSIPAWTGGYTQTPAGYKQGDKRADPFASEKPVVSISGKNLAEYSDKLAEGTKIMLQKYPNYRLDVYPTHRTAAAPQWVYDNTLKNATSGKLDTATEDVSGVFGGIPFPIPKNGMEVLWNHRLSWNGGDSFASSFDTWLMTAGGKKVLATRTPYFFQYPYYFQEGSAEKFDGNYYQGKIITELPASKNGEGLMIYYNTTQSKRASWQYLVGQRRVRRLPNIAYDTPNFVTSGVSYFDEAFMLFGPTDKHDLKLVGKKELYIPYNSNKSVLVPSDELVTPNFLNPDHVRWEKHRVWVVEATLKAGQRHVVPRRTYYVDEDTWQIVLIDGYDAQGKLIRQSWSLPYLAGDLPALTTQFMWGIYNIDTGAYVHGLSSNDTPKHYERTARQPSSVFTPDAMANESSR
ncbi:DUF1329 domain-containing protein [Pseudomonas sp. G5(2012)]|uniref:DUF1329 domain-containing protein n=1 Tax=Pseudomonas sp. G5(2012) TaxID=1268068 RepID=UPI0003432505|nr:DUF1329 domain-containing protein [Pseudomonas sp. G5(2012)]EPA99345.1 hypothetical protein PG5_01520 [Pseudomonas sp. G5(2012)]